MGELTTLEEVVEQGRVRMVEVGLLQPRIRGLFFRDNLIFGLHDRLSLESCR